MEKRGGLDCPDDRVGITDSLKHGGRESYCVAPAPVRPTTLVTVATSSDGSTATWTKKAGVKLARSVFGARERGTATHEGDGWPLRGFEWAKIFLSSSG